MTDIDETVKGLRKWAATMDDRHGAALELLCWHDFWLRRADFREACVARVSGDTVIRWREARELAEGQPRCSTSEETVLRLAVAIGLDDFGLSGLGHAHRRAVVRAFATAAGVDVQIAGEGQPGPSIEEILGLGAPGD